MLKKLMFYSLVMSFILITTGCGSDVDTVKDGYLPFDTSMTVGEAFDNYEWFTSTEWTSFETTQKRKTIKIVELKAMVDIHQFEPITEYIKKIKESYPKSYDFYSVDWWLTAQFTVDGNGNFELTYIEASNGCGFHQQRSNINEFLVALYDGEKWIISAMFYHLIDMTKSKVCAK